MKVSLIYPVFDRGELLRNSLKRLRLLPTQPDEIIIVDDGSTKDNIEAICEEFNVDTYLRIENPKYDACSRPKNIGLKNAKYDVVIYSEPEVIFVTDVIGQMKTLLESNPDKIISCGTMFFEKNNFRLDHSESLEKELENAPIQEWVHGTVDVHANDGCLTKSLGMMALFTIGAYKKHLINVGGWDEDMMLDNGGGGYGWDDTDLCTRLRVNGHNQLVHEDLWSLHQWHDRVPFPQADGWKRNQEIFDSKKVDNDIPKENIVANKDREWGII